MPAFMRRKLPMRMALLIALSWMAATPGLAMSPEVMAPLLRAPSHAAAHKAHVRHSAGEAKAAKPSSSLSREDLLRLIKQAATANKLPADYLKRLIRQESGFDERAVSAAGAQGIAQFMPSTAQDRGLKDPFDPTEALPKSAELLHDLKLQFGNLGLAAAAYNAGPRRVRDWLGGASSLPRETWDYVYAVTGRSAKDWAPPGAHVSLAEPDEGFSRGTGRKNWELALLLAIADTQNQKLLATEIGGTRSHRTRSSARSPRTRFEKEAALCGSCIIQQVY
jgi:soluble lytic murein transglycosylase-like protein